MTAHRIALVVLPVWLLSLCGCAGFGPPPGGDSRAQAQTVAACRERANEAYDLTHRDQIYAPASQVNTPFSANYQPGIPDRGLSALFAQDRMVSDCVRNTGAASDRMPQAAVPPPAGR